jgi:hypothetical protein
MDRVLLGRTKDVKEWQQVGQQFFEVQTGQVGSSDALPYLGLTYNIRLGWKGLPGTNIHKSIDYGSIKNTMTMLIMTLLIMTLLIMTLLIMTVLIMTLILMNLLIMTLLIMAMIPLQLFNLQVFYLFFYNYK